MISEIKNILPVAMRTGRVALKTLLHGKPWLSITENIRLFDIVHKYIAKTGRNP